MPTHRLPLAATAGQGAPAWFHPGALLAACLWGGSFVVGHAIAARVNPVTFTAWRYTVAALAMLAWAWWRAGAPWRGLRPAQLARLGLMALCGHSLFSLAFLYGVQHTPPILAALLNALQPAVGMAMAALFLGERVERRQLAAMAAALAGCALCMSAGAGGPASLAGTLATLASVVLFGAYSVLGRTEMRQRPALQTTSLTMLLSVPFCWLAVACLHAPALLPGDGRTLAALAYFAAGVTVAAFLGWNASVARHGVTRTMPWMSAVPAVTTLLDALAQGAIHWRQLGGVVVACGAVALGAAAPGRRPLPTGPA